MNPRVAGVAVASGRPEAPFAVTMPAFSTPPCAATTVPRLGQDHGGRAERRQRRGVSNGGSPAPGAPSDASRDAALDGDDRPRRLLRASDRVKTGGNDSPAPRTGSKQARRGDVDGGSPAPGEPSDASGAVDGDGS